MKKKITEFINSIEGFGNLVVTKPDGTIQKHGFKNTITKHFRENLINAILYGDQETLFDSQGNELTDTNPEGYYWSNKLIAYQFKVTVGKDTTDALLSSTIKDNVKNGFTSTLDYVTYGGASAQHLGESRYGVIGNVDTRQAQLIEGFNPQEMRMGKDLNPDTGEWTSFNAQNAFDFNQNVFVGYTPVLDGGGNPVPGLKQPLFKPARENVRIADNGNLLPTINIDKYTNWAKSWFDWDVLDSQAYGGTQSIIRQSMGAGKWTPAAFKTDDEEMIAKYQLKNGKDVNGTIWVNGSSGSDATPEVDDGRQYSADNGDGLELIRGVVTKEFFEGSVFDGEDSKKFYAVDYTLDTPEERWYWSFNTRSENTEKWNQNNPSNKWITRDVETEKTGQVVAIEVQNFPSKVMYSDDVFAGTYSVDPETIAYYCPPAGNQIKIDRNDNLTVEYNFKFTTPTGNEITWNGMYLDELARAINPVKDTEQITNSANKIQMTGAVLYESGVFENTVDNPTETQVGHSVQTIGGTNYTTKRVVPNTIKKKHPTWTQTGAETTTTNTNADPSGNRSNSTITGSTVHRKTANGANEGNFDPDGKLTSEFARIWVSPSADLFTIDTGATDFTNDMKADADSSPYNYDYSFGSTTWTDRRSFYAQTNHTRKVNVSSNADNTFEIDSSFDYFQFMVSLLFDSTDGRIDFTNNRCQIFISPYGNIANAIIRHAKLTNWLNDYTVSTTVDVSGNIVATGTAGASPVINIETIWQNGLRLFGASDGNITSTGANTNNAGAVGDTLTATGLGLLHNYSDDAVKTLKMSSDSSDGSYMVRGTDTSEAIPVIDMKITSDSRFVTPPKFFTVNYGSQNGHPVPGNMHDQKIQSGWYLKEDWTDELDKLSEAGGFSQTSGFNWTDYYRSEDRDLIEQTTTNQKEHYLSPADPTGYGVEGFLKTGVFPEHQMGNVNYGVSVLHDYNDHKVYTESESILGTDPVADFSGDNTHTILYGGELYSHGDGSVLWDFQKSPVVVVGYVDENALAIEEPSHRWTELHLQPHQITVVDDDSGTTIEGDFVFRKADATQKYQSFVYPDPGGVTYNDFSYEAGNSYTVVTHPVFPTGHPNAGDDILGTNHADVAGNSPPNRWEYGNEWKYAPKTLTAGMDLIGTSDNDSEGNSPPNATWAVDDTYYKSEILTAGGQLDVDFLAGSQATWHDSIVGTSANDARGNPPQNGSWDIGDSFVLAKWEIQDYDQFLGQKFSGRDGSESTIVWDFSEINYPDRVLVFNANEGTTHSVVAEDAPNSRFISNTINTLVSSEATYITYDGDRTLDNYKNFMVRLKQLVGSRNLKKVSLRDYIPRTIDFDPTIYEKKMLTETGIQYSYIKQGDTPVIDNSGVYSTSDTTISGGNNFAQALQQGYRETAPFRLSFARDASNNNENISDNYDFLDNTTLAQVIDTELDGFKHAKDNSLILKRDASYGRFGTTTSSNSDNSYSWPVPTNTPFGDFTSAEDKWGVDTTAHYGFTPTEMEDKFPVYKCWTSRMIPSIKYDWYADDGETIITGDFPIPASFRVNGQVNQPLVGTSEYNDGSTTMSYAERLMDEIEEGGLIPFPSIVDMITLVKTIETTPSESIKIQSATNITADPPEYTLADAKRLFFNHDFRKTVNGEEVDNEVGDTVTVEHYFRSDTQLMQFVTSIAPYGFKEMYEYDNATPNRMRLSLPHPDFHMFFGFVDVGAGSTGGANIGDSGPTWTPGDQVQLSWTVKPPASGSGS